MGERRVDLVFKGGGVKGIALIGALAVLEAEGFQSQNVAGTSAGAIVAALHAAGYSAAELREILADLDFRRFMDKAWEDRVPGLSILLDQGMYEGQLFLDWITDLLAAKGKRTFGDLAPSDHPRFGHRLQVVASDVTSRCFLVLPRDAHKLGISPDDLEIGLAVRMSMSIPIFFEPVHHLHPDTGEDHLIVDGGMLSNFPVWLFDARGEPRWPTFGLTLSDPTPNGTLEGMLDPAPTSGGPAASFHYFVSLVKTMIEAHDRLHLEDADYVRSIAINNLGVRTTEFDLSAERVEALYQSGVQAASTFLAQWSFARYVEEFRSTQERP